MQRLISNILVEIKPKLRTPFMLIDRKGDKIFGDDVKGNVKKAKVRLCGAEYMLLAELTPRQMNDFCLLLEEYINGRFNDMLKAFVQGKETTLEEFPFPCGLLLLKSELLEKIEPFINSLFNEVFILNLKEILLVILPVGDLQELKETSIALYQTINEEISSKVTISIGGIARSQNELAKIFSDAQKALKFSPMIKSHVLYYPEMTMEKLFSSIPAKKRQEFAHEIGEKLKKLDTETFDTIRVVLECNLNMSEAARRLYIHRNTLMYRLEKIASITGLDLRNFKDAIILEIYFLLLGLVDSDTVYI
ncbi:PucR family transcriptional regulator [Thermoanaerobacterium sp. DL9XJH110]|uniref:PucR family transcriptional regulator n=1 Tax=Thermoanaerobacterium sp. DL9XJH110 TaxID=3386643 RepID=UPI003BB753C1